MYIGKSHQNNILKLFLTGHGRHLLTRTLDSLLWITWIGKDYEWRNIQSQSALHAEDAAISEFVKEAILLSIQNLIQEGDSLTIINTLKNKWKTWENQLIVKDIEDMLQIFTNLCIFQCYREENQAANCLSHSALLRSRALLH